MRGAVSIVFIGHFHAESFCEFVCHRARRLQLDVVTEKAGDERIEVRVAGPPDLIDAFEMACSLGPIDCVVREVERRS